MEHVLAAVVGPGPRQRGDRDRPHGDPRARRRQRRCPSRRRCSRPGSRTRRGPAAHQGHEAGDAGSEGDVELIAVPFDGLPAELHDRLRPPAGGHAEPDARHRPRDLPRARSPRRAPSCWSATSRRLRTRRLDQGRPARERGRGRRGPHPEPRAAALPGRVRAPQAARPAGRPVPARRAACSGTSIGVRSGHEGHVAFVQAAQGDAAAAGAARRRPAGRVGHHRDHGHPAAPLPVPARGPHHGARGGALHRGHEERHHQRAVLPGALPRAPDHAGGADPRGDGPGGRAAAAATRWSDPERQAHVLHEHRQREVPPPGDARRPAATSS